MFIFCPCSCFCTFFYLSIWQAQKCVCLFEYYEHFSACLRFVLKAKQNNLFSACSDCIKNRDYCSSLGYYICMLTMCIWTQTLFSFSLRKHLLWFLPQYVSFSKPRWKSTDLFWRKFPVGWCILLVVPCCERSYRKKKKKKITCSGRQTIEICPEIFFIKAEYAGKCE